MLRAVIFPGIPALEILRVGIFPGMLALEILTGEKFRRKILGEGVYIWRKIVHTRARGVCKKKLKIII